MRIGKKFGALFLGVWMAVSAFAVSVQAEPAATAETLTEQKETAQSAREQSETAEGVQVQKNTEENTPETMETTENGQPQEESAQASARLSTAGTAALLTNQYGAVSVQYALLHEGEMVESGTSGVYSKTENRPLNAGNLYGVGSVSKVYTAAAAMKLVEEGKLELDRPVAEYLPEFSMADDRYKEITVRMLMNHSSGLQGTTYGNAFLFGDNDTYAHDHLLENLKTQTLKADPGEIAVYCNDGFTLLELVVEAVSGASFTEFLHTQFFAPAGLSASFTPQDSFDRSLLARTYLPLFTQETPEDTVGIIGTGGIYASAEDLCRFGEILMGDKPEILSKESAEQMMAPEYERGVWPEDGGNNTVAYGLGWDSVDLYPFSGAGIKAATKGGDTMLYHSALVVLPEYHISAAVLSSGGSSSFDTLFATRMIENYLLEQGLLEEPLPVTAFTPAEKQPMPEEMKAYTGLYGVAGATISVIVDNGELRVPPVTADAAEQVFAYVGDGKFMTPDGSVTLYFETKENGHTYLMMDAYGAVPGLGMTRSLAYNVQRLEKTPVPEDVLSAWQARDGQSYYLVNEKPTSQLLTVMPSQKITLDAQNGYAMGCKIVDENTAVNVIQMPMMNGRDTFDLVFSQRDGKEYLSAMGGMVLLAEKDIPPIYDGLDGICTIQEDGYVRWYKAPEGGRDKQMAVTAPDKTAVFLYDASNNCIENSVITGAHTFTLPEGGKIAFAGAPGDVFAIAVSDVQQ